MSDISIVNRPVSLSLCSLYILCALSSDTSQAARKRRLRSGLTLSASASKRVWASKPVASPRLKGQRAAFRSVILGIPQPPFLGAMPLGDAHPRAYRCIPQPTLYIPEPVVHIPHPNTLDFTPELDDYPIMWKLLACCLYAVFVLVVVSVSWAVHANLLSRNLNRSKPTLLRF